MTNEKVEAECRLIEAKVKKLELEHCKYEVDIAFKKELFEKVKMENNDIRRRGETLSGRYPLVPSASHVFQSVGAGLVLAGAFFFLYQPVVDSVRITTEAESTLATLEAKIEGKRNKILSNQLFEREEIIKKQDSRYSEELKQLEENLQQSQVDRDDAIKLIKQLKFDQQEIAADYRKLQSNDQQKRSDLSAMAEKAQAKADNLTLQLEKLKIDAVAAQVRTDQVRDQINFSKIRGARVTLIFNEHNQTLIAVHDILSGYGAIVDTVKQGAFSRPSTIFYFRKGNRELAELIQLALNDQIEFSVGKNISADKGYINIFMPNNLK